MSVQRQRNVRTICHFGKTYIMMLKTMSTFVKTAENLKLYIRESERVNPVLKAKLHTMNVYEISISLILVYGRCNKNPTRQRNQRLRSGTPEPCCVYNKNPTRQRNHRLRSGAPEPCCVYNQIHRRNRQFCGAEFTRFH